MRAGAACANLAWLAHSAAGYRGFVASLGRVRQVQESILNRHLRRNAATLFGREHGLSRIRSAREYQAAVPLSTWDDYVHPVERIAAGEPCVLTRDPVRLFEPTSGSTRAAKWIPYTASLQSEFSRAVAPWVFDLYSRHASLMWGPAYWSITPALQMPASPRSRIPVGFQEDSEYLGGAVNRIVRGIQAVPGGLRGVRDLDQWRRLTLLFLLRARDLRLISIWHPSFLALLLFPLEGMWRELVAEIGAGIRVSDPPIVVPPDRGRARELSRLDPSDLAGIWPKLRLISCWGDAHAAMHLAGLRRLFPHVEIQPKGLIATEAIVSFPFKGLQPLAVTSHFFEFLDPDGRALAAWELRQGGIYSLVVTTGGGLYRYRLHDRVEVTGFLDQVPCLRFLGKEDQISDLFGEKLSEGFVAESIRHSLECAHVTARFAMLAPETSGGASRYVLYLEADDGANGTAEAQTKDGVVGRRCRIPASVRRTLESALETALEANPNYDYCVRLGQLAPVRVCTVDAGASGRYAVRLQSLGQRLGVIKPSALSTLTGWASHLISPEPRAEAATLGAGMEPAVGIEPTA